MTVGPEPRIPQLMAAPIPQRSAERNGKSSAAQGLGATGYLVALASLGSRSPHARCRARTPNEPVPPVRRGLLDADMTLRMLGLVVLFLVPAVQLTAEEAASPGPTGAVASEAPAPAPTPGPDLQDGHQPPKPDIGNETSKQADTRESMCLIIESAARAQDLPLEFFARVIWQESRFQPDAV